VTESQHFIGRDGAEAVQALVRRARGSDAGLSVSIAGLGALLLGAMQVFNSLQTALNVMWDAPDKPEVRGGFKRDLLQLAKKRALSFGMVLVIGWLLVLSLLASAGLSAFGAYLSARGRVSAEVFLLRISDVAVSLGSLTCLLAVIYKLLPDARIAWRDVWFGAVVTSCLLTIGKVLIGWYLGSSGITSVCRCGHAACARDRELALLFPSGWGALPLKGASHHRAVGGSRSARNERRESSGA